jgi:phospholipid/cholesterol/gamma-HCH transport system ATP-binding protein
MRTVHKVADRVVMLYPFARLHPGDPQVVYDGPTAGLEGAADVRVTQFVAGHAGDRLTELRGEMSEP